MFCSSLRKRPEWASVPRDLLSRETQRWQEKRLETHDIAIPLPQTRPQDENELFRIILLSATDVSPPEKALDRMERLYHQTGGRHVGIMFLIRETHSQGDGTRGFMSLQARLVDTFEIPLIPFHTISSLQTTLFAFHRQIVQTRATTASQRIDPIKTLLPYCSVNGPIPEHARNVLSDICHSIPQLAQAATTQDGQKALRQWLSESPPSVRAPVANSIIDFWEQEYVVE